MKFQTIISLISITLLTFGVHVADAQESSDACSQKSHTGTYTDIGNSITGTFDSYKFETYFKNGLIYYQNEARFYEDGSFICNCDLCSGCYCTCRYGLSYDGTQTHEDMGHIYADFNLEKSGGSNFSNSYIGIYGSTSDPHVEYYIVDNWLGNKPTFSGSDTKTLGNITIDGATYTVYSVKVKDGYNVYTQIFSIRDQERTCGTIDITEHFKQWEDLGVSLGKLQDAKFISKNYKNGGISGSGKVDFKYAKIYIKVFFYIFNLFIFGFHIFFIAIFFFGFFSNININIIINDISIFIFFPDSF